MDGTDDLIDAVMMDVHHIDQSKLAAAANTKLRARLLREAQRALLPIWSARDWSFKYVEATVSLTTANDVSLPAAWGDEGRQGGVWNQALQDPIPWARAGEVTTMLRQNPSLSGPPRLYTVIDAYKLRVFPTPDQTYTIQLRYEQKVPVLTDAEPGNLDALPYQWRGVLFEALAERECAAKGDSEGRATYRERYARALYDMMCGADQGKPWPLEVPRHPATASLGGDIWSW